MRLRAAIVGAVGALVVAGVAQWPGAAAQQPAAPAAVAQVRTPRSIAPIDLTGYWVAIVSEDWRWRMMTPPKGDYASIPLSADGLKAAGTWSYEQEQSAANACKPFGIGGIMRMPGRLHITWQDETTLKLEFDAGTQTRLLRFAAPAPSAGPTWQGDSAAVWEIAGQQVDVDRNGIPVAPAVTGRGGRGRAAGAAPRGGSLRVNTTNFKAGFLRKNGVPYSEKASIQEYFDRVTYPNGDSVLLVRTVIEDPQYLQIPFITSTHFKLEPDGARWKPTPCAIDPPVVRPSSPPGR